MCGVIKKFQKCNGMSYSESSQLFVYVNILKYIACMKTVAYKSFSDKSFVRVLTIFCPHSVPILSLILSPNDCTGDKKGTNWGQELGDNNWGQKSSGLAVPSFYVYSI